MMLEPCNYADHLAWLVEQLNGSRLERLAMSTCSCNRPNSLLRDGNYNIIFSHCQSNLFYHWTMYS